MGEQSERFRLGDSVKGSGCGDRVNVSGGGTMKGSGGGNRVKGSGCEDRVNVSGGGTVKGSGGGTE